MLLFTLVLFWAVALCVPMPVGNNSAPVTPGQRDQAMFKGIDWSLAKETCNEQQLEILERATYVAVTEMLNPRNMGGVGVGNDPMWTWFFKTYSLWTSNPSTATVAKRIANNLRYPYDFVLNGKKPGNVPFSAGRRLLYSCAESRKPEHGNCRPQVAAYTANPEEAFLGKWTVTFCPKFWTLDYADRLFDPKVYKSIEPADLNSKRPYEATIIHEYFHVDYMGFANFAGPTPDAPEIIDEVGVVDGVSQKIYGATLANKFAWNVPNAVNPAVSTNADNYALYALSKWANKKCGGIWNKQTQWNAPDPNGAGVKPPGGMVVGVTPTANTTDMSGQIGNMTV